jgi:hypothetical protein
MANYTKGPWIISRNGNYIRNSLHGYNICAINNVLDEANANAHLISAAPDLLEACKECAARLREVLMDVVTENNHTIDQRNILRQTEKAISKAEGET